MRSHFSVSNKIFSKFLFAFTILSFSMPVQAIEFNLFKVESPDSGTLTPMGTPQEAQELAKVFSKGYGFPQSQVAPAMLGPTQEVPTILRIAQAAGTSPFAIWGFRRLGMSYQTISNVMGLASLSELFTGSGQGPITNFSDAHIIRSGQQYFLGSILKVQPQYLSQFPLGGYGFVERVLRPYDPVSKTYFLPPGIAKKYGLWMPPGQAKKFYGNHPNWNGHWKNHPTHGFGKSPGKGYKKHSHPKYKKNYKASSKKYDSNKSKGPKYNGNSGKGSKGKKR